MSDISPGALNATLNAITLRNSASKLTTPAPSKSELEVIFQAALRAPDHANLKPWRFIVVGESQRAQLGELLVLAKQYELRIAGKPTLDVEQEEKLKAKPFRAPIIIIPVLHYKRHEKVPEIEQLLSLGCACQNVLLALESLSYSALWRTGNLAFSAELAKGLQLADNEKSLGFIYVGTRDEKFPTKKLPQHNLSDFVSYL